LQTSRRQEPIGRLHDFIIADILIVNKPFAQASLAIVQGMGCCTEMGWFGINWLPNFPCSPRHSN
jgi:hypothetical protein